MPALDAQKDMAAGETPTFRGPPFPTAAASASRPQGWKGRGDRCTHTAGPQGQGWSRYKKRKMDDTCLLLPALALHWPGVLSAAHGRIPRGEIPSWAGVLSRLVSLGPQTRMLLRADCPRKARLAGCVFSGIWKGQEGVQAVSSLQHGPPMGTGKREE